MQPALFAVIADIKSECSRIERKLLVHSLTDMRRRNRIGVLAYEGFQFLAEFLQSGFRYVCAEWIERTVETAIVERDINIFGKTCDSAEDLGK